MLLYFVKSKNDTKCKNFINLLCSYVNTFILLYFRGATAPLNPPLIMVELRILLLGACAGRVCNEISI